MVRTPISQALGQCSGLQVCTAGGSSSKIMVFGRETGHCSCHLHLSKSLSLYDNIRSLSQHAATTAADSLARRNIKTTLSPHKRTRTSADSYQQATGGPPAQECAQCAKDTKPTGI